MANSRNRFLTKSRYKLALECPTKLFYSGKRGEYEDTSVDDPFLIALARGGFQVGALAQSYYPNGNLVSDLDHTKAVEKTKELIQQENVTIFEGAFQFENLFIRIDIVDKIGDRIRLIEVKSKSYDPRDEDQIFDKKAISKGRIKIKSDYSKYIYDLAFQTHVFKLAFPNFKISNYLMMADKSASTTVDGLNQLFLLTTKEGRTSVTTKPGITESILGKKILCEVNMDKAIDAIHNDKDEGRPIADHVNQLPYAEEIKYLAKMYVADKKVATTPNSKCKDCEFRTHPIPPLKSGFSECWVTQAKLSEAELLQPFAFDVWDFRRADLMIDSKKFLMQDLCEEDIGLKSDPNEPGLSRTERQWLQIRSATARREGPFVDLGGISSAASSWTYPLHFVDFETAMVAIPFNKDCRPYQSLAFQFSHHIVSKDGNIEHTNQYLNMERGKFPNFEFIRELKKSLQNDSGTIFRYAHHENTILCQIFEQLKVSTEPDRLELMKWIQSITKSGKNSSETWVGPRSMVDMCDLVKSFYYHPSMGGSNSIKKVLPAILGDSPELQSRFSKAIYGSKEGIKSLNFKNWTWIRYEGNKLLDPYRFLPKVYGNIDATLLDKVMCDDELQDGGSAMTAYAMMQFTEMPDEERKALGNALLKYCELDTFAMVLLYEYWKEFVTGKRLPGAA
ncbi:MAG: DUF2779 domain-containing protein [Oligoflexales bacterium]